MFSYTSPRVNVVRYSPWYLRQDGQEMSPQVLAGKAHGDGVVASLEGIDDRDAAEALIGAEIEVDRATLGPELEGAAKGPAVRRVFLGGSSGYGGPDPGRSPAWALSISCSRPGPTT